MKRHIKNNLLLLILFLSIASVNAFVWESKLDSVKSETAQEASSSIPGKGVFFTNVDVVLSITGTSRSVSRINNFVSYKVDTDNVFLRNFFDRLTTLQYNNTRLFYTSFYSERLTNGYYIYALRKLLI